MAHRQGMPLKARHIEFLKEAITAAIDSADPEAIEEAVTDKPKAYVPTIQDRLNEKTSELIGELEGKYDDMESVKFYDWLTANNVVQSQLSKYEAVYQKRKDELELAQSKKDDQVTEGYKHYKAADFKKHINWINDLLAAVEQYRGVKKATKKARVKKAPSKEKLIAKLKYAKEDKALKIVSINPADIIGSSELWVYNVKTRKLGKYIAASYQTLNVKGTTITGFDTDKSVCKTLRKPEEKLKEFAKAGKIQLRKFLDEIKATETKLNGRIGTDVVLLRTA
jgi:phage antirepressor YoqD-like protein